MLLYSNMDFINEIDKYRTAERSPKSQGLTKVTMCVDGRKQVSGDDKLKQSQAYPVPFGVGMAKLYQAHEEQIKKQADMLLATTHGPFDSIQALLLPGVEDVWDDANLSPLLALLHRMHG